MRGRSKGFSLIELLVVIIILALGLYAVGALFVAGTISASKARRITAARQAGEKEVERLRSAGFAGCIVDPDIFSTAEGYTILQQNPDLTGRIGFELPTTLPPGSTGTIDIAVYQAGAGYYPNLKDLTVSVIWPGGGVTGGTLVLHTLIANRP